MKKKTKKPVKKPVPYADINDILEYLYHDEANNYAESEPEYRKDHIFTVIMRVMEWVDNA